MCASIQKRIFVEENFRSINEWIIDTRVRKNQNIIGYMYANANDFQHNNNNYIVRTKEELPDPRGSYVTDKNLLEIAIYYAVRHCIAATWLNDRDQFHYPTENWQQDFEFQNDSMAFLLLIISKVNMVQTIGYPLPKKRWLLRRSLKATL